MMHAFVLTFIIFTHGMPGEDGTVAARSCDAAETYIRAGLLPGQTVTILDCARRT